MKQEAGKNNVQFIDGFFSKDWQKTQGIWQAPRCSWSRDTTADFIPEKRAVSTCHQTYMTLSISNLVQLINFYINRTDITITQWKVCIIVNV